MAHLNFEPFQTVQPETRPPPDYQQIQTNPREFGSQVAAGAEHLGEGLSKAGQFFGEVAADDATNKYMTAAQSILSGDPAKTTTNPDGSVSADQGYFGLRGQDSLRARPQVKQQLDDLRNQLRDNMQTPDQQLLFDQYTRRFQYYMGAEVDRHADEQAQQWYGEVEKASSDVAKTNISAAVARNDDLGVQHATSDLVGSYVKQAQRLGGGPDLINDAMLRGRRDAAVTEIMARAPTDASGAQVALEKNRGVLSAQEYEELSNRLKVPATDQAAQSFVYGPGATPQAGIEAAPRNNPGNIRPPGSAAGFMSYPTPQDGMNAISHNLDSYADRGINTLSGVISRWAPPNENPTGQLIANASQRTGIDPNQQIDIRDPATKAKLISAIVRQEQGHDADPQAVQKAAEPAFMGPMTQERPAAQLSPDEQQVPGLAPEINRIMASDLSPQAKDKAAELARMKYTSSWTDQTRSYEVHQRAQKQASDDAENHIIADAASDNPTITAQAIANNAALTPEAKLRMMGVIRGKAANPTEQAISAYGPGFWALYQRATASPGGQLAPLTDQAEVMRHAGPGGDLTLAGAQELTKTMAQVRHPEQAGDTKLQAGALAYAKRQLSFEADYGTFKVRDPKGEDSFNIGFLPAFMSYWQKGIAAGKTPTDLVSKDAIDSLVAPYKRPPAELMKDQLGAGEEMPAVHAPPAPVDLEKMNQQQLIAAVRADPTLRAQAEGVALKNGWIRAEPAPPLR